MQGRNVAMIAIAIVLGLFAVFIANSYFSGVEENQIRAAEQQKLARIVVASRPLEFGAKLAPENIRMANFPANSIPEGAFMSLDDAMRGGRVALRPVVVGEPILASKVSGTDGRAVLSANLPEGMRAVSIPITAVSSVSGFVRPGDTVDVLLTRTLPGTATGELVSQVILERVPVLAINQGANEADTTPTVGQTATVQVDMVSAQKLAIAMQSGTLSLALRNIQNETVGEIMTVSSRNLTGGNYIPAQRVALGGGQVRRAVVRRRSSGGSGGGNAALTEPAGASMSVVRGTETTDYAVKRLGGR